MYIFFVSEYICSKYSKSAVIKEALEEKMFREKNGISTNINTITSNESSDIKDDKIDKETLKKAVNSGMIDL